MASIVLHGSPLYTLVEHQTLNGFPACEGEIINIFSNIKLLIFIGKVRFARYPKIIKLK